MNSVALPLSIDIAKAAARLQSVTLKTPLQLNHRLSEKYRARIYLKREDLQLVRSYKLRGAYNLMSQLPEKERSKKVVCASAGNHAQGVAFSCRALQIHGVIFMPTTTPKQKINQVKIFGEKWVEVALTGDTFDECQQEAIAKAKQGGYIFVPPFDHPLVIEGQGTVGKEIIDELRHVDYVIIPIGGGGLCSGIGIYLREQTSAAKIIGVEPEGAASMKEALRQGKPVTLEKISRFVDGAAVKKIGAINFDICKNFLTEEDIILVPDGKVCSTILQLYNEHAIIAEPAGALSIAALDQCADRIIGKNVVCILSGGNNDINRMQEIKERSLLFEGLKHYFIVRFAQRPGALKEFVNDIMGPTDDIVRFEYMQKHNKENGPALIGIEVKSKEDYSNLVARMNNRGLSYTEINQHENLFEYIV